MGKRKADTEQAQEEGAGLSAYESERQLLIARNRARLEALGIPSAVTGLEEARTEVTAKQKQKPRKKAKTIPPEEVRKSSRLHGGDAQLDHVEDEATHFAMFLIDGECPKCGKVLSSGHRKHWDSCSGTGEHKRRRERDADAEGDDEVDELTAQEIEDEERDRARRQKGKLQALELNGLIDFTHEHAKFVVLGSTGKHYTVTLAASLTCQCMDFRLRRRMCKHIRLVLVELGIEKDPGAWHQAIEKNLLTQKKDGDAKVTPGQSEQSPAKPQQPAARKPASTRKPQVRAKTRKLPPSLTS